MISIDLNADIGEGCGDDAALLPFVSSASIACGGHAGDTASMREALRLCRRLGVAAGAHPSHEDPAHFGRRALPITPQQVHALMLRQVQGLLLLAEAEGLRLQHCKPHGALYHQLAQDAALAEAACLALRQLDPQLAVFGLAGSELPRAARRLGLRGIDEAFADRAYRADGQLLPRSEPGAVLGDAVAALAQLLGLCQHGGVRSVDGTWLPLQAQSVCLHGDTAGAARLAAALHAGLQREGIAVRAPGPP